MTPTQIALTAQSELQARRRGMRTLDPTEIALHFGRAAELRAALAPERPRSVFGASGTKGACSTRPR